MVYREENFLYAQVLADSRVYPRVIGWDVDFRNVFKLLLSRKELQILIWICHDTAPAGENGKGWLVVQREPPLKNRENGFFTRQQPVQQRQMLRMCSRTENICVPHGAKGAGKDLLNHFLHWSVRSLLERNQSFSPWRADQVLVAAWIYRYMAVREVTQLPNAFIS